LTPVIGQVCIADLNSLYNVPFFDLTLCTQLHTLRTGGYAPGKYRYYQTLTDLLMRTDKNPGVSRADFKKRSFNI